MQKIRFILFFFLTIFYHFSDAAGIENINQTGLVQTVQLQYDFSKNELDFEKAAYPDGLSQLPAYVFSFNAVFPDFDYAIQNMQYQKLPDNVKVSQNVEAEVASKKMTAFDQKKKIGSVIVYPYRKQGNSIEVLTSFQLQIIPKYNQRIGGTNFNYAPNSVLASGNWYKFGVTHSGLYKLDYNFLKSLGVQVDAINPANIRIFGNEGGMLPELAGAAHTDDLREYAVKVVTSTGSNFQNGDYVLVYCPGPDSWTFDNTKQQFICKKHLYSNTQNLFITTDAGSGTRVATVSGTSLSENRNTDEYDAIDHFEEEKKNIALSGKIFLGDEFLDQATKTYGFSFPDMITSDPLKIDIAVAAASENTATSFAISTNSTANARTIFLNKQFEPYPGILNTATWKEDFFSLTNQTSNVSVTLIYSANDFSAKGYLDFINIQARCNLVYNGTPLYFRDKATVGAGNITKFIIQNANSNMEVWDVTNPFSAFRINYNLSGSTASFVVTTDSLREFAAFENTTNTPVALGSVANQNLHASSEQDMVIVARKAFLSQAGELAQFHRIKQGLRVLVVDYDQVLNEFSSGTNDITAIRNLMKMFYDRAGSASDLPKYLLLFGDGTYINRELGDYYLPTFQSLKTFETLQTYVSDDYFGLMDDNEGSNLDNTSGEIVDIGVGRIPADNVGKAQIAVDKIKEYYDPSAYGEWRNQGTFIADDEDGNTHIRDADLVAREFGNDMPCFNIDKIYLDAYPQQAGAGGATYPQVNDAINKKMFTGTLFMNYVGHGGGSGLAQEAILGFTDISSWDNRTKMPLFITATCELSRYDEYDKFTAGERIYFKENGGGIALVTTTRVVFSDRNKDMNLSFMDQMVLASANHNMTIGDINREAKKNTPTSDGNRKFTLLGDPALQLAFPRNEVVVTQINNVPISQPHDTLKSLAKISIKGEVRNPANILMADFNGIANLIVYDKVKSVKTLVNDPESDTFSFDMQKNTVFKGKTTITNGKFEFSFLVPKDIDYNFGVGKLSLYASTDTTDATGCSKEIIIGGVADTVLNDNDGPLVDVFMNDENFVFGGITDENPDLLVNLSDENGINTSGNGIGHDITGIIDNDTRNIIVLNDFYESEVDNVTVGKVKYPFSKLSPGRHTLRIKAWDILNNSGEGYTEFIVEEDANLAMSHVLNYPNPFTTHTTFMFEHNKPGQPLDLRIEIFSVSGKVVKTIQQTINSLGFRVADINWDGRDDYGDKIGKGVYIYRVTLSESTGKKVTEYQKLVLLN